MPDEQDPTYIPDVGTAPPPAPPAPISIEGQGSGVGDEQREQEEQIEAQLASEANQDAGDNQGEEPATTTPDPAVQPPAPAAKTKAPSRYQRKIDQLVSDRTLAENRANRLAVELRNLQQQIAGEKEPQVEDFKDYAEFVKASGRYAARLESVRLREQGIHETLQQGANSYIELQKTRVQEGREEFADWDTVVPRISEVLGPHTEAYHTMFECDNFARIAHYLGSNPTEAYRISTLEPRQQAREILRLDNKFTDSPTTPSSKRISQAPAPGKQAGKSTVTSPNPNRESMDDYAARRNKEYRSTGRRF